MTEAEMRDWYKDAKDKKLAIEVLSDMNLISKAEVQRILGLNEKKGPAPAVVPAKPKRERMTWTAELVNDLKRFLAEGLSYKEIAERMGLDYRCITNKVRDIRKVERNTPPREQVGACADDGKEAHKNSGVPAGRSLDGEKEKSPDRASGGEQTTREGEADFDVADSLYIKQLEEIIKEKTEEIETLKKENDRLAKSLAFRDSLEEIRSLADCAYAIDFNELLYFDSAKRLLLQIIEICDEEMKRPYIEKSSASAGTDTEQSKN